MIVKAPGGTEQFVARPFEPPAPGPNEVLLRHTAVGVNFIDVYHRTGLYPWPVASDAVVGSEGVGVIEAVGPGCDDWQAGQRVAYTVPFGGYSTHRLVRTSALAEVPDGIDDATAAAVFLKGLTAYYLVSDSYPAKSGDQVLFHAAAGGVGLIAGQWLQALGAGAIGTAGSEAKCELAREYGYEHVINYTTTAFADAVLELTGGAGVAAVYDGVGAATYPGSVECLARFGTLVSFGQSSGPATAFKIADLARGSLRLTRPVLHHFTADRSWLLSASAALFKHVLDGVIRIRPPAEFALTDAALAHRELEGRKTTGSTVLIP